MKRLYLFCILLCFLSCGTSQAVNVVFRLDDPSLQYDSVHLRIIETFNSKNVPLSVAIVPCDTQENAILPTHNDSLYIQALKCGNIEIALHGLTHEDINHKGEFGGLNKAETERRIKKGKDILELVLDKKIITFIPPFNAYNPYTEEVLSECDISILSADLYGKVSSDELNYFPETLGHLMQQKGIWHAAKDAIISCTDPKAICVVMFHAYDLPNEESWKQLNDLLVECLKSKNVSLHTFKSLTESGYKSNKQRYNANQLESGLQKYCMHHGVLHSIFNCYLYHFGNALCYALLPLMAFLYTNNRRKIKHRKSIYTVSCLVGALSLFILAWFHICGPLTLLAIALGISAICIILHCLIN